MLGVLVGHYMGGVMYGVTHLIMGPPILGRVPYVAGRGMSILVVGFQSRPLLRLQEHNF